MLLSEIKPSPKNPRLIRDHKFKQLVKSVQEFPAMLELRPIIVDDNGQILGGNMRFRALEKLGYKEIPDNWVKRAADLSDDEKRRFVIEDNVSFGEWDFDALANDWDTDLLKDWGVDLFFESKESNAVADFGDADGGGDDNADDESQGKRELRVLADDFIVPPFSILDSRSAYWRERKRKWFEKLGRLDENERGESRMGLGHAVKVGHKHEYASLFDPVLSEILCTWFTPGRGSKIFDPFAGDTQKGLVFGLRGHSFTGIELRQEQVAVNLAEVEEHGAQGVKYICDDGRNVAKYFEKESQDLLFSCPPYFNLEVYSDLPNDASAQKRYGDFLKILEDAFTAAAACLKNNRFAVVVVGDVRDKKTTAYRDFPGDVKRLFARLGMPLYNELVLIEEVGSRYISAGYLMKYRKVSKNHQNVLVFYKGDTTAVREHFPEIEAGSGNLPFNRPQGCQRNAAG